MREKIYSVIFSGILFFMRRARGLVTVILGLLTVIFIVFNVKPVKEVEINERSRRRTSDIISDFQDASTNFQTHHSVTPSLAELGIRGMLPEMNEDILMVTRVPGAGVELLVLILQRLQGYNAFKHIRLPPGDGGLLSTLQQELLVEEITSIIRQEAIPLSFDGDVRFLNFSQFGRQAPVFTSLVRDPMDPRSLQRYRRGGAAAIYRGSISHFCGQDPRCTKINTKWRLERAKANVLKWYKVIGLLEHMEETLSELERKFPYFFTGALKVYKKLRPHKTPHNENTVMTLKPSAKKRLGEIFKDEVEFYMWLKSRLLNGTYGNG
ncbi:uronyl 2-sulfotransferase [Diachasma alloeum]|uniref:uronyl 2-sulfotransferase n=1 Tax=Diachasma alloeum TaxID=454923 RepID=UPI00073847EE|nr:uronyl 2-sulfotransferase [Diachasma alloeum]